MQAAKTGQIKTTNHDIDMIAQEPGLRFNRRLLLKEVLKILQIEKIEC